eukprot:2602686-Rhodomonas_salina.1
MYCSILQRRQRPQHAMFCLHVLAGNPAHTNCSLSLSSSLFLSLSLRPPTTNHPLSLSLSLWLSSLPQPPPCFAGVLRNYTYELDRPVQKANQALVASIPMKYKQVRACTSSSSILAPPRPPPQPFIFLLLHHASSSAALFSITPSYPSPISSAPVGLLKSLVVSLFLLLTLLSVPLRSTLSLPPPPPLLSWQGIKTHLRPLGFTGTCLSARYAMCGTDSASYAVLMRGTALVYGATQASYAVRMRGTDLAVQYCAAQHAVLMRGTDLAYGATQAS